MQLVNHNIKTLDIEKIFYTLKEQSFFNSASLSIKIKNTPQINIEHISEEIVNPLFPIMSISKTLTASILWRYYIKGYIKWSDPIIKFWPEFGRKGKEKTTIKQILSHTAGIPNHNTLNEKDFADWGRISEWIEDLEPEYKPGERIQYHSLTYGWVIGEIINRISGKSFEEVFNEEVAKPLNLHDTMFVIPDEKIKNVLPLKAGENFEDISLIEQISDIQKYKIILPAASAISTSRDICKFFSSLSLNNNNEEWLPKKFISSLCSSHAEGIDIFGKYHRIGLGIILPTGINNKYGAPRNNNTIGHGGMGIATAWKDVDNDISVAFLTTTIQPEKLKQEIHSQFFKNIRSCIS